MTVRPLLLKLGTNPKGLFMWRDTRETLSSTIVMCLLSENDVTHNIGNTRGITFGGGIQVKYSNKGYGSGRKSGSNRNERKLNRIIRECGDHFKLVGSARVPLFDTMNSMVELINS
ncbi:hypothetical protein PVK06_017534 [Gossypium arboreum]|uniref:Uncharacterized protein n=1 Tax=Gossypium arboreum TaxID=29729 RepID=A0ABR0Q384_GOSAR|nr:hypothetical protein PVK06_017534 [Gossypium arboreum]